MTGARRVRRLQVLPGGKSEKPRRAAPRAGTPRGQGLEVADSSARYEILFESASDAMLVIDLDSAEILSANHAALELTGYLRDDLIGQSASVLFPEDGATPAEGMGLSRSENLRWSHIDGNGFFEDLVLRSSDGHPRYVSMSAKSLALDGSRVSMCIIRDVAEKKGMERDLITKHTELREAYVNLEKVNAELKATQESLIQSGKLAALGELAAGIAHELNQPLTAVKGFGQEAIAILESATAKPGDSQVPGEKSKLHDCLDEVVAGADKMEKIISHLRNFTRKSTADFEWVDVHSVINESLVMLDRQLRSRGIQVTREFGADIPKVWCNPFQLEQVFINLATNARDAIEAQKSNAGVQGVIGISTRVGEGGNVEVRYSDNGCGISDAVKGKIFNPFFTTKEVGAGMGLGLSISYGILSRLNASILVESAIGRGTVFTIRLPVDYRNH